MKKYRLIIMGIVVALVLYISLVPLRFPEYLLTNGTAIIKVTSLRQVPRECNSSAFWRYRSSNPLDGLGGYCGTIMSDHGPFQLPEDRIYFFGSARAELIDLLEVDCYYRVNYYGYRATVYKGMPNTNKFFPKIVSASEPSGPCNGEGES